MERKSEVILVIDDDRASRRMLARALREAGYVCRESEGGVEALQLVHEEAPSLLLLDFHMPGLNGAEVVARLRSDERTSSPSVVSFERSFASACPLSAGDSAELAAGDQ